MAQRRSVMSLLFVVLCQVAAITFLPVNAQTRGDELCLVNTAELGNPVVPFEFESLTDAWYSKDYNPQNISLEKHVPLLEQVSEFAFRLTVPHVMDEDHHIEWLFVTDELGLVVASHKLDFNVDNTAAFEFDIRNSSAVPILGLPTALTPWEICNLHKGWHGDPLPVTRGELWDVTTSSSFCARPLGTAVEGSAEFSLAVGETRTIVTHIVDDKELHVTFTMPKNTWMGMGVGDQMHNADVMVVRPPPPVESASPAPQQVKKKKPPVGQIRKTALQHGEVPVDQPQQNSSEWECVDMYVVTKDKGPQRDEELGGSSQVWLEKVESVIGNSNLARVTCVRPLIATDECCDRQITKSTQGYVFAFGTQVKLEYHTIKARGLFEADLSTAVGRFVSDDNTRELIVIHGVLMTLIWAVLVPFGAAIVRYQKHCVWWLGAHRFIQLTASLLTIPSLLLAVGFIGGRSHLRSTHARLGVTVAGFNTVQAFSGWLIVHLSKVARRIMWHVVSDDNVPAKTRIDIYHQVHLLHKDWMSERDTYVTGEYASSRRAIERSENEHMKSLHGWYRVVLAKLLPFKSRFVRPSHRYIGRSLVIVAFVQLYLGNDIAQLHPVMRTTLTAWTICFSIFVVYKEIELFFDLPFGILSKVGLATGWLMTLCGYGERKYETKSGSDTGDGAVGVNSPSTHHMKQRLKETPSEVPIMVPSSSVASCLDHDSAMDEGVSKQTSAKSTARVSSQKSEEAETAAELAIHRLSIGSRHSTRQTSGRGGGGGSAAAMPGGKLAANSPSSTPRIDIAEQSESPEDEQPPTESAEQIPRLLQKPKFNRRRFTVPARLNCASTQHLDDDIRELERVYQDRQVFDRLAKEIGEVRRMVDQTNVVGDSDISPKSSLVGNASNKHTGRD